MDKNYKATIKSSGKELTVREKVKILDFTSGTNINEVVEGVGELITKVAFTCVVSVHNEKSDMKDYDVTIYVDPEGQIFYSGSTSLASHFSDIADEIIDSGDALEDYEFRFFGAPSKNFTGRNFLSCTIV